MRTRPQYEGYPQPEPKAPPPTEWWLHVRANNTEVRFAFEPVHFQSLHVKLLKDSARWWEQTATNSLKVVSIVNGGSRAKLSWEPVRPQGVGWKLYANNGDHCIWRRRRQPLGPLMKHTATLHDVYPLPRQLPLGA